MKKRLNTNRRTNIIVLGYLIAIGIGIAGPFVGSSPVLRGSGATAIDPSAIENQPSTGELQKGTPNYETILPAGKSISDYGGWTRVSPPNRNPVYAYADTVNRTPIIVSQQPLPKNLGEHPVEQIGLLARGYNAEKKLQVGPTTVYIGTSAKGPQSVIFTKNGLLILIRASANVPDDQWQQYISSLR